MNDARRQLLHEMFKLVDLVIMMVAFVLAVWASLPRAAPEVVSTGSDEHVQQIAEATQSTGYEPLATTGPSEQPGAGSVPAGPDASSDMPMDAEPHSGAPEQDGGPVPAESLEASKAPTESFLVNWYREHGRARLAGLESSKVDRVEAVLRQITLQNVFFVMAILIVWHAAFKGRSLYNSRRLDSPLVEVLDVLRAGFFASLVVSAVANPVLTAKNLPVDPAKFTVHFFLIAVGTTIIVRVLMRRLLEQMRLRGRNLRAVLIIGTNHRALRFAKALEARSELGYYVVGFVDEEWDGIAGFKKGGHKLVAGLKDLSSYIANNVVDEVVVALPVSSAYIYSSRIVSLCQEQGLTVRFVSQIFDSRLAKGKLDIFDDEPMLSLEGTPDESFSKLFKRMMDRVSAALLLIAILPLFVVVAIAIKLTSKGPVFFVQNRVGLNKRMFGVYKFRTMVEDAEERLKDLEHLNEVSGPVFKLEKDPRLTPIGDFLRRTSIDELPQLINVLRGDMSLVGPRPLPERDYLGFDTDAHRRRLSVRPGITCIWQVSGRNSIPFEQWMKMDLEYIDNWSIWLDFKLLLQTIPVVLGPLLFFRKGEFVKGKTAPAEDSDTGSTNAVPTNSVPSNTVPSNTGQGQ